MYLPSFLRKLAPDRGTVEARPARDWFLIVAGAALLLVLSIAWNAFLFIRLTHGEALDADTTATEPDSGASVNEIRNVFEHRGTEETRYRSQYQFVDPSRSGG